MSIGSGITPDLSQFGINNTPQPQSIEQTASQAPQQLGQALQQQQQAPQQQQGEQDPVRQALLDKVSQANNAKFGVKQMLTNFFSGMAHGMLPPVQTPEFQQQRALTNLASYDTTQANASLHRMMAQQFGLKNQVTAQALSTLSPEEATALGHPDFAGMTHQNALAILSKLLPVEQKPVSSPLGVEARPGLGQSYQMLPGTQVPLHQLAPGEAESLGFPPGTPAVKEADYATAVRLKGTSTTTTRFLPDGAGGYIPVPVTTTRQYNAPQAGGTTSTPGAGGGTAKPGNKAGIGTVGPVYAYDPKTNDTVMTTSGEWRQQGFTNPRKVTQKNIEDDRQLNNRLYDVANKLSLYEQSVGQPITDLDRAKIADLIGNDKLQFGALGAHLPTDWLTKLTQAASVNKLSQQAQNRLIAYYNAREAMTGYTRVLTGSGRSNETTLQLNLQALPDPVAPDNFTRMGIQQFKQNIDNAGQGLPRMPGIKRASDVVYGQGQPQTAPPVRIQLPDGRTGTVPASSLPKYQGMGAKVLQ